MFYVFHVDTGTTVTLDTELALKNVSVLTTNSSASNQKALKKLKQ